MARAIWTGTVSFGLVTVPVKLYTAVQRKTVRFHQLHATDGVRIEQKRVCPADGEEVPWDEIVKGYEIAPDRYVVIEPEELAALERQRSQTIEIEEFVSLDEIDPIYYDHPYYLAPGPGGAKPYKLLVEAMRASDKVAIARFVLRSKEHLVALRPAGTGDALMLETMIFVDEVVAPETLDGMPDADTKTTDKERQIARQLIESLVSDFEPDKYADTYREQVLELIERKAAGEEIAIQPPAEQPELKAVDLMGALQASLDEVRARAADGAGTPAQRKRAAAGKGAARKPAKAAATGRRRPAKKA